jgi:hypothetical protein
VPKVTYSEIAPLHLLAISRQLVLVLRPLLVFYRTLGSALLALDDADEGVDDDDEEDGATDAAGDGVLGGVGEAGPFLLGSCRFGEFV